MLGPFLLTLDIMASILIGANTEAFVGWAFLATTIFLYLKHKARRQGEQLAKATEVIESHAKELSIRRRQLTIIQNYGVEDSSKWEREVELFISRVVFPATGVLAWPSKTYDEIRSAIQSATSGYATFSPTYSKSMDPIEYEQMVADLLIARGWVARLTKASGDQGVDVLASKSGITVVLQCKLYSKPVGNSAVQEAIAGKAFEQADHAAVITNAGFTRAAQQLANTAGVILMHHDQLDELEARCTQSGNILSGKTLDMQ